MKSISLLLLATGLGLAGLPASAQVSTQPPVPPAVVQLMTDYGSRMADGNREGIIRLFDERGAFTLVDGLDELVPAERLRVYYQEKWSPPKAFAWRELNYRPMSPDVVLVTGAFDWTGEKYPAGAHFNYSATLVRTHGTWKIRSVTEFPAAGASGETAVAVTPVSAPVDETPVLNAPSAPATTIKTEQEKVRNFARAYEPVQLGLTRDEGDEIFMDFTLSLMFPLLGDYWDAEKPAWKQSGLTKKMYENHLAFFFSGTVRAGQYIAGRPSAPVVEKRFNPQVFLRYWVPNDDGKLSAHRYLDFIPYGHESNGQAISTLATFNEQREIYRQLESDPGSELAAKRSFLSARDTISRGWDYVGLEGSWSTDDNNIFRIKVREFLPYGYLLQKGAEQSHDWEGYGPTHPRRQYDGLMFQYTGFGKPIKKYGRWLTGRYTFTYTTGLSHPTRHNTFQLDLGAEFWRRPVSIWLRSGYNSDLIDYYQRDNSAGLGISIWTF